MASDGIKYNFEEEAMHELTEYYRHIFTLKSGKQIEILTENHYDKVVQEEFTDTVRLVINGFILTPLIVEKAVKIRKDEIAVFESIKEKYIAIAPWPEDVPKTGVEVRSNPGAMSSAIPIDISCDHPEFAVCAKCVPLKNKLQMSRGTKKYPSVEKYPIYNSPPQPECKHSEDCKCWECTPVEEHSDDCQCVECEKSRRNQ